jgi:pimeloyl-ACP methyl ester carboxylesterase
MSHTPPIPLRHGSKTFAYASLKKPERLVVFVHGFKGSPSSTWGEFPLLMRTDPELAEADVIFYGYDSTKEQANNNAVRFYELLKSIIENSFDRVAGINRGFGIVDYSNIVLVAHSLGSIVVRRALLYSKGENKAWLNNCKMVLFAPAHRGSRVQNIALKVLPKWVKIVAGLGLLRFPVVDDLMPESQTIKNLIKDTQAYLDKNDGDFSIAHIVVWAADEIIVHNEVFCCDPVARLKDKNHITICKPVVPDYPDPFDIVKEAL